ncbi:MAG: hypothetical protein M3R41_06400 [Pseudomonadota bacterium]|nr:hypothetical protein [Pseudomonadota bacterium]
MRRFLMTAMLAAGPVAAAVLPVAATAQTQVEGRVDRLESEMRAVQRKVFPGGAGQAIAPENSPQAPEPIVPGSPSNGAVTDLSARVDALESQLARLTGQVETTGHRVQLLEESFAAYKRATDVRLKSLEGGTAVIAGGTTDDPAPIAPGRATAKPNPKAEIGKADASKVAKDPARGAKIAAIEKPSSGDAGEDAYLYGYRLWAAKLYPEAETQLKSVIATYPTHKRLSYARNLLGRSYLDEGTQTGDRAAVKNAANTFLENYQKTPDGDRAPESLYFLGQSLNKLDAASGACRAYDELGRVYADKLTPDLKLKAAAGRVEAKCK